MAGIKNFFVKGKPIKFKEKGIINYYRYLNNKEHKNHKGKTHNIYNIINNNNFIRNAITSSVKMNLEKSLLKGKGGRYIKEFGHSFVFSPPEELKLSKEDWTILTKRIMRHIFNYIKENNSSITKKELLKHTFVNVHEEDISHINFLFSKVIGGKPIHWSKYKINMILKQEFNLFCLDLGLDYKTYKPKSKKNGKNIYNSNKQKEKEIEKEKKELSKEKEELSKEKEELNNKLLKIKELSKENKANEEAIKKLIKRFGTYINRVIIARQEKNLDKERKNITLIKKNKEKLNIPQKMELNKILDSYEISL